MKSRRANFCLGPVWINLWECRPAIALENLTSSNQCASSSGVTMDFLFTPWEHQRRAFDFAKNLPEFGLFFDPGTGKTATTIQLLRYKYAQAGRLLKTLVLVPPVVVENWKRELLKFSRVTGKDILLLQGPGKKRVELLKAAEGQPKIIITNYESLLMPELYAELKAYGLEGIILDESHKIKSFRAKRTKAAVALCEHTRFRYILTGTPVLNSPEDLFSQFLALDNGRTFGKRFYAFQSEYFFNKNAAMQGRANYFPDWRPKPGTLEKIGQKISAKTMQAKKAECMDLPPLVKQTIFVALSPEQRRLYDSMKEDFIAFMGSSACVAELAITKALRLQQIVSGYVKTEDGIERDIKDNPRQTALKELLEEITPGNKVLVWAVFKENYAQIRKVCESLNLEYVEVHGEVSAKDRQENVDRFNNDEKVRVFIGHPGSGGIGINLVSASYTIFYSRNFSLEQDIQAEARNYRGGSEIHAKITRIDIVAQETVDVLVTEALAKKEKMSETILKASLEGL
jgi:SNF2 family DNA or RNA helicase